MAPALEPPRAQTRARPRAAQTHARTHTCPHARARTHTQTQTHTDTRSAADLPPACAAPEWGVRANPRPRARAQAEAAGAWVVALGLQLLWLRGQAGDYGSERGALGVPAPLCLHTDFPNQAFPRPDTECASRGWCRVQFCSGVGGAGGRGGGGSVPWLHAPRFQLFETRGTAAAAGSLHAREHSKPERPADDPRWLWAASVPTVRLPSRQIAPSRVRNVEMGRAELRGFQREGRVSRAFSPC